MGCYYTKEGLYREIDGLKDFLNIGIAAKNVDLIQIAREAPGLLIEGVPFNNYDLRGMAIIGENEESDIILLNNNLPFIEQNFYCGHEMTHLALHRRESKQTFNCFDKLQPNQNSFLEWQANETSAEIHVSYRNLLPIIKKHYGDLKRSIDVCGFKKYLADDFNVTESVIKYRLESLKYEIYQYIGGTDLNDLEFLSNTQQKQRGLKIKSLNDIENDLCCVIMNEKVRVN